MLHRLFIIAFAVLFSFAGPAPLNPAALAQPSDPPRPFADLTRLADDTYAWRYQGYDTIFVVTDEGVILGDPIGLPNPREPELLKAVIRSVTDQPVKYLIYSHGNEDHAAGADAFLDTATLIGTPEAAEKLARLASPRHPVPSVLVADHMRLELGGVALDLYHAGHTQGSDHLYVHYPARHVLWAVDFIPVRALPFRDFGGATDIEAWMSSLDRIAELDFDVLVPGHGEFGDKTTVRAVRQYLQDLSTAVRAAQLRGLADGSDQMAQAVRADLASAYGTWGNFDSWLPLNIQGVLRIWSSP